MIEIQNRVGRENFPLIHQAYYPNHREMVSNLWVSFTQQVRRCCLQQAGKLSPVCDTICMNALLIDKNALFIAKNVLFIKL